MIAVQGVRPVWLRPGAWAVAAGLHVCAALLLTLPKPDMPSAVDSVEITIARGEPESPPPPPEVKPEPPPPEPPPEPPKDPPPPVPPEPPPPPPLPEPPPPPVVKAPKREVADAPALPRPPKPKPPRPKPPEAPAVAPPPVQPAPGAEEAEAALSQAKATYASKVLQEIRNHRISAVGAGSVVVAFAVDTAGEMVSATVVRSSGKQELDEAALRMVRAARPGPPPDGRFAGSTTINFIEK